MSAEDYNTVGPCQAAESSAWPGDARCPDRWPDTPRGWCRPCKTTEGAQEIGTSVAGFTRVGNTVYPHGTIGELSALAPASPGHQLVERLTYLDRLAGVEEAPRPTWTAQDAGLELLALTADYPVEHPLRQAAARLTTRLALAEGKIETAASTLAEGIRELAVTSEPEHPSMFKALEILKR